MTADIPKFNHEVIPVNLFMFRKIMRQALSSAGRKQQEVSYYIYPTFSTWDQKAFCQAFMIEPEKVFTDGLRRHGHLQETDMVLDYVDAIAEGHVKDGDLVMLTTNGAGFSWGAALIQH
jgi:3-oxoacyl-[acyl-carrier-protein] synthase-3